MTPKARAEVMCRAIQKHPNVMIPWYLMASWLYYHHDLSLLPDEEYDKLCKKLLQDFDRIEHPHKCIVDREGLSAGTGYAIKAYPLLTQGAALHCAIEDNLLKWNKKKRQWESPG